MMAASSLAINDALVAAFVVVGLVHTAGGLLVHGSFQSTSPRCASPRCTTGMLFASKLLAPEHSGEGLDLGCRRGRDVRLVYAALGLGFK